MSSSILPTKGGTSILAREEKNPIVRASLSLSGAFRAALRRLIEPDPRSPMQFSDHVDCDGAKFFKAAAELGLAGIVSKRVASRYRSGPSRSWLKTKNTVEGEFILLGTERDSDGVPGRCWHHVGMAGLSLPARLS